MEHRIRVLLIEDSEDDRDLVVIELKRGGFNPDWLCVENGEALKNALDLHEWDIILSDYSLPNFDGLSALKIVKERQIDIPFILISGTIGEDIAVTAMKTGAHDYIMKGNLNRLTPAITRELKEAEIRKQHRIAAKALRDSEEKFRIIVQHADALIITLDKDGIITLLEGRALQLLGLTSGQLVGSSIFDVYKDIPEVIEQFRSALAGKSNRPILKLNGFLFECLFTPLFNTNKEFTSTIVVAVDITEKIQKEIELKNYREHLEELVETRTQELDQLNADLIEQLQKEKELEKMLSEALSKEKELSELKTRFISTASHEFRTPLTTVLSSAELILRYGKKWNEDKLTEHVVRIKNSVEYLSGLMNDVLTLNRADSGKVILNLSEVNLRSLCENIIEESQLQMHEKQSITFEYNAGMDIYKLDSKQINTIIQNLISNAIKYSLPEGKISVKIVSVENQIEIIVSDNGIGIPENDMPRLFEPFHRSVNAIDIKGTGLGLSIVKKAVELHNGEIIVKSELGKGTEFTVSIPGSMK